MFNYKIKAILDNVNSVLGSEYLLKIDQIKLARILNICETLDLKTDHINIKLKRMGEFYIRVFNEINSQKDFNNDEAYSFNNTLSITNEIFEECIFNELSLLDLQDIAESYHQMNDIEKQFINLQLKLYCKKLKLEHFTSDLLASYFQKLE